MNCDGNQSSFNQSDGRIQRTPSLLVKSGWYSLPTFFNQKLCSDFNFTGFSHYKIFLQISYGHIALLFFFIKYRNSSSDRISTHCLACNMGSIWNWLMNSSQKVDERGMKTWFILLICSSLHWLMYSLTYYHEIFKFHLQSQYVLTQYEL